MGDLGKITWRCQRHDVHKRLSGKNYNRDFLSFFWQGLLNCRDSPKAAPDSLLDMIQSPSLLLDDPYTKYFTIPWESGRHKEKDQKKCNSYFQIITGLMITAIYK
jgi:hypothetical protein